MFTNCTIVLYYCAMFTKVVNKFSTVQIADHVLAENDLSTYKSFFGGAESEMNIFMVTVYFIIVVIHRREKSTKSQFVVYS